MPRRARHAPTGSIFHVVNRGVERRRLFFEAADYQAFIRLLTKGKARWQVKILGICIMPNHYHLLLHPLADGALTAYLHWVQGCYACDLRARTGSKGYGHVFQQRFWSGIVFDDLHFLAALRYVEANPREGELVTRRRVGMEQRWQCGPVATRC
jgi:putative transposase